MPSDSNNNPHVGPGSYLGLKTTKIPLSRVPFSSKSDRNLSTVQENYNPGKKLLFKVLAAIQTL